MVPSGERVYVTYVGRSRRWPKLPQYGGATVRDGKIVEVEVYFGWNVPHPAPSGGFVEDAPQM